MFSEETTGCHWSGRQAGRVGSPVEAAVGRAGWNVRTICSATWLYRSSSAWLVAWMDALIDLAPQSWPGERQYCPQSIV